MPPSRADFRRRCEAVPLRRHRSGQGRSARGRARRQPRRVAQKLHELGDTWADDEPRAPAQRQTRSRPRQAAIIEAIKTRARGLTTLETRFETVVGVPLCNVFREVLTHDEILRDLRKAVRRTRSGNLCTRTAPRSPTWEQRGSGAVEGRRSACAAPGSRPGSVPAQNSTGEPGRTTPVNPGPKPRGTLDVELVRGSTT